MDDARQDGVELSPCEANHAHGAAQEAVLVCERVVRSDCECHRDVEGDQVLGNTVQQQAWLKSAGI